MRGLLFPPIFLGLAACATPKTIEVKVPVPVPCVMDQVDEPVYPQVSGDAGLFERVKALLAERELRKGYEERLKGTIAGCMPVRESLRG